MDQQTINVQSSYNHVASAYVARIVDELAHKPFDRHLLNWFSERVQELGQVCDVGCGPGHVAHYLREQGVSVLGLDLSTEMVAHAQRLYPDIPFIQGNMYALDIPDATWGGIIAFYSIIHIPREDVVAVLRELKRVLRPGGVLLLAFHIGQDIVHLDEWWDESVALDFVFFQIDEMSAYLITAGFEIEVAIERAPYVQAEYPSRRAYICARNSIQLIIK
jgi:SAM-dependent methyltransferase